MARVSSNAAELSRKITSRRAHVAVIGLGYVGLPMACDLSKLGFAVTGIDMDRTRIQAIADGRSYVNDLEDGTLRQALGTKRLFASSSFTHLVAADVIIICVPTPLNKTQDPDLSFIMSATAEVKKHLRPGQLIILESTTYPGTTEEVILPELEEGKLRVGRDFFLCFSPERVDPGNRDFSPRSIPKVVGGVTRVCRELGVRFYSMWVKKVVPVSSTRVAEMAKLLENTFRIVNIGLINELAIVARTLGIDIWEVIEAASTKPFGFMPFYPGPGVGGHCIGIDPVYLAWKARRHGKEVQFVDLARLINTGMPQYIVDRVVYLLNEQLRRKIHGAKILVLGVTYKKDIADVRESPALEILSQLEELGARITYHDPFIPELKGEKKVWHSKPLTAKLIREHHLVLFLTDHTRLNRKLVAENSKLVFDVRNALRDYSSGHIVRI